MDNREELKRIARATDRMRNILQTVSCQIYNLHDCPYGDNQCPLRAQHGADIKAAFHLLDEIVVLLTKLEAPIQQHNQQAGDKVGLD